MYYFQTHPIWHPIFITLYIAQIFLVLNYSFSDLNIVIPLEETWHIVILIYYIHNKMGGGIKRWLPAIANLDHAPFKFKIWAVVGLI